MTPVRKRKGARLGQHFLTARWAAMKLAGTAVTSRGEIVLEIGPGKGALTKELLTFSDHVIAIEKDGILIEKLRETFKNELSDGRLTLVPADVRDVSPEKLGLVGGKYVLAANIPYYITGEIIRQFLTAATQPRAMVLLVQKEVAQHIVSKKESILSLSVKVFGSPRIVAKVGKGSFSPPPSVDSAILS
ncbi:MAG: Ribosomal RNA small subunit methyltransferase A, partial [Candidatus Kaiserbacteria bacterium GW2011_GWC2_52_8b]